MPFDINNHVMTPESIAKKWGCAADTVRCFMRDNNVPAMLEVPFVGGTKARYYDKNVAEKYFDEYTAWRKRHRATAPPAEQGTQNLAQAKYNMAVVVQHVASLHEKLDRLHEKLDRIISELGIKP